MNKQHAPLLAALFLAALLVPFSSANSNSSAAAAWLTSNQLPGGSWSTFWLPYTSLATVSLYKYGGTSQAVAAGENFLASNVSTAPEWGDGESIGDSIGSTLYALGTTDYTGSINAANLSGRLLSFQNSNTGGIDGWVDSFSGNFVGSSTDTSWAIIGLEPVGALPNSNKTAALNFLSSLQNSNGSVALASDQQSDGTEGLGPDLTSTTALTAMAYSSAGSASSKVALNAIGYLEGQALGCFNNQDAAFASSTSTIAFEDYGQSAFAAYSADYLESLQNPDGGFADQSRSTHNSNAIDTGIALWALTSAPTDYPYSLPCSPLGIPSLTVSSSISNGTSIPISATISGPVLVANASIILPDGITHNLPLEYSLSSGQYSGVFPSTSEAGNYTVTVYAFSIGGSQTSATTYFEASPPAGEVGVVTLLANGTLITECAQAQDDSTAESVLKSLPLESVWANEGSLGDALASLDGEGCSASDPFCQCTNYNVCCLTWNLWGYNTSTSQWYSSEVGYTTFNAPNGTLFANVWGNSGRTPPATSFPQACPSPGSSSTNTINNTDALACNECTTNSECTSGFCVHGTCRATAAYCGDGFCDAGETCNSCPADCGQCSGTVVSGTGGGNSTPTPSPTPYPYNPPQGSVYTPPASITTPLTTITSSPNPAVENILSQAQQAIYDAQQQQGASSPQVQSAENYLQQAQAYYASGQYYLASQYAQQAMAIVDWNSGSPQPTAYSGATASTSQGQTDWLTGLFSGNIDAATGIIVLGIFAAIAIIAYYFGKEY